MSSRSDFRQVVNLRFFFYCRKVFSTSDSFLDKRPVLGYNKGILFDLFFKTLLTALSRKGGYETLSFFRTFQVDEFAVRRSVPRTDAVDLNHK